MRARTRITVFPEKASRSRRAGGCRTLRRIFATALVLVLGVCPTARAQTEATALPPDSILPPLPASFPDAAAFTAEHARLESLRVRVFRSDPEWIASAIPFLDGRAALLRARITQTREEEESTGGDPASQKALRVQRHCWSILLIKALCVLAEVDVLGAPTQRLAWAREADDLAIAVSSERQLVRERTLARLVLVELLAELGSVAEAHSLAIEFLEQDNFEDEEYRRSFEASVAVIERRARLYDSAIERAERVIAEVEPLAYDPFRDVLRADQLLAMHGTLAACLRDLGIIDRTALHLTAMEQCMERLLDHADVPIVSLRSAIQHIGSMLRAYEMHEEVLALADRWMADPLVSGSSQQARWELRQLQAFARVDLESRGAPQSGTTIEDFMALRAEPYGMPMNRRELEGALAGALLSEGRNAEAKEILDDLFERFRLFESRDASASDYLVDECALRARLAVAEDAEPNELEERLQELRAALSTFLDSFVDVPLRPGGVGFLYFASRRWSLCELVRMAVATRGPAEGAALAFEDLLAAQCIGALARSLGAAPSTIDAVRSALCTDGSGVLFFLPGPEHSHVFALDAHELVHAELARESELDGPIAEHFQLFGEILSAPSAEREALIKRERAIAHDLAAALIPPDIEAALERWESVSIVGTELLGNSALEFLPAAGGDYLGLERAVAYLPSIPIGVALVERESGRIEPSLDFLLVAAPANTAPRLGLASLPLDSTEIDRLASEYSPGRRRTLAAEQASQSELFAVDLGAVSVLQFLLHGATDSARERPAVLALHATETDASLFGSEEVESLLADVRPGLRAPALVLLTACESARGPWRPGDDASGHLGGAWLRAGSRAVCLSPTALELGPTLELSQRFHTQLTRGRTPCGALQVARRDLLASGGESALYGGGLLRVVGLGHVPLFGAPAGAAVASGDPGLRPPSADPSRKSITRWTIAALLLAIAAIATGTTIRRTRRSSAG